jgi:hypothetical protein
LLTLFSCTLVLWDHDYSYSGCSCQIEGTSIRTISNDM